jgi:hypothetical protein
VAVAQALPTWQGNLADAIDVSQPPTAYRALSIDGSQIYPDRHAGVSCFLINIGMVDIVYGPSARARFASMPYIFAGDDAHELGAATPELVNCRRQEYELNAGVPFLRKAVQEECHAARTPTQLLLFDGSLIFWHLASKDYELRSLFLHRYMATLHAFHDAAMLCAWYISLPKSKELVNLMRYAQQMHMMHGVSPEALDQLVDAHIAAHFLQPYSRSVVFQSHIALCMAYPAALRPYFFYLHCGQEIARVEIPAWIAADEQLVNYVACVLVDQARKGYGYPVALAEAHEQAVVKGPDRDFFYHCIAKLGIARKQRLTTSLKSRKKRGMGI